MNMKMFLLKRMLLNYIRVFLFQIHIYLFLLSILDLIYINSNKKYMNEELIQIAESTTLPSKKPSDAFKQLLTKINDCEPSPRLLRKIIKVYMAETIDTFDPIVHADLSFTEVL